MVGGERVRPTILDQEPAMNRDTPERYGTVSRIFHWTIALLVAWQAPKIFDRFDDGEHWVGQTLVPWHISVGVLVLVLVVPRIFWALRIRGTNDGVLRRML